MNKDTTMNTQPKKQGFEKKCLTSLPMECFQTLTEFLSHDFQYDPDTEKIFYTGQENYMNPFAFRMNNVFIKNDTTPRGAYIKIDGNNFTLFTLLNEKLHNCLLLHFEEDDIYDFQNNFISDNWYNFKDSLDDKTEFQYYGNVIVKLDGYMNDENGMIILDIKCCFFQKTHVRENDVFVPISIYDTQENQLLTERVEALHVKFSGFLEAVNILQQIKNKE